MWLLVASLASLLTVCALVLAVAVALRKTRSPPRMEMEQADQHVGGRDGEDMQVFAHAGKMEY